MTKWSVSGTERNGIKYYLVIIIKFILENNNNDKHPTRIRGNTQKYPQ